MWIEDKEKKDWIWKDNESDSKRDKWLIATTKIVCKSLLEKDFKDYGTALEDAVKWCLDLFKDDRQDIPVLDSKDNCIFKSTKEMSTKVLDKTYVDIGTGIKDYAVLVKSLTEDSNYTLIDGRD